MRKTNLLRLVALVLIVALCLPFAACKKQDTTTEPTVSDEKLTYTVKISNEAGQPLEKVGVYIYIGSAQGDLVWFDTTDEKGTMTFTDVKREDYVAVLQDVTTGYEVAESYPITGEVTEIVLKAGVMSEEIMDQVQYKLGDVMMDFTVTATDGKDYTLSELLKLKDAVVLNFWYINCSFCVAEFPFMQEVYEQFSDRVEFLALNPIDTDAEAVAEFWKSHKLSFPAAVVDAKWGDMFQIKGYPTTVIIDRFGTISLIHGAQALSSAKQLADALTYFTDKDYKGGLVTDIDDLHIEEEAGSEENPEMLGASEMFEVTVEPGQVYYSEIGKVQKVFLTIYSKDAYIIYEGKTYEPKNGVVSVMISAPDMYTPAKVGFGNSSDKKQTFKVYMSSIKGSYMNPFALELGEFTAKVNAGNDQGIYYVWTAKEDGTLSMKCLSVTPSVQYSYFLFNTRNSAMRNLEADAQSTADGSRYVSIAVKAGDKIQFSIGTLPDETNSYPAATFTMLCEFSTGAGGEQEKEVEIGTYTIQVVDNAGNPMPNVSMKLEGTQEETKTTSQILTTDASGKVVQDMVKGNYKVSLTTPKGYTVDSQVKELTAETLSVTFTLSPIVIQEADYTVTVVDPDGNPVSNVMVIIKGTIVGATGATVNETGATDASGKFTVHLTADTYTVFLLGYSKDYTCETSYTFPEGSTELTIQLTKVSNGDNEKPEDEGPSTITEVPFTTASLKRREEKSYTISGVAGKQLEIHNANAYVVYNNVTYGANDSGIVIVQLGTEDPVNLSVGNAGRTPAAFKVEFKAPYGTEENPQPVVPEDKLDVTLEAGDTDGHSFTWTATSSGKLLITWPGLETEPTEPETEPTEATESTEVTDPTETTEGAEVTDPTETTEGAEVTDPTEATESTEVTDPTETTEGAEVTDPTETTEGAEVTDPTETTEATIPEPTEPEKKPVVKVVVTNVTTGESCTLGQLLTVNAGDVIVVTVVAEEDENQQLPPVQVQLDWKFEAEEEPEVPESSETVPGETTEPATDPTAPGTEPTTEPTEPETEPTEPETQPTEPEPVMIYYLVTVTDYDGNPSVGTMLTIWKDGVPVAVETTDEYGEICLELEAGNYTVTISGSGYYYDATKAKLSANSPELLILLAKQPDANKTSYVGVCDNENVYNLVEGGYYVSYGPSEFGYSTEMQVTLYSFVPARAGVYRITTSNANAKVDSYNSSFFVFKQYQAENNVITKTVQKDNLGMEILIGLEGSGECILEVLWVGEPGFDPSYVPYETYMGSYTPKAFTYSGGALTYVDIVNGTAADYTLVYNETDGYYHLGHADGPTVYVNLGTKTTKYISLDTMINGSSEGSVTVGGVGFRSVYYDSYGGLHKEDYTDLVNQYIACVDANTGIYPLTADMAYMLQKGIAQNGWADPNSESYQFDEQVVNPDLYWMFMLCY